MLVVEDDRAARAFLLDNLAADGFGRSGLAGRARGCGRSRCSSRLLFLDLILEDGSGLDRLDRVRAADGLASQIELQVIVLTGRDGEADRVRSFSRGADDRVESPRVICFRRGRALS